MFLFLQSICVIVGIYSIYQVIKNIESLILLRFNEVKKKVKDKLLIELGKHATKNKVAVSFYEQEDETPTKIFKLNDKVKEELKDSYESIDKLDYIIYVNNKYIHEDIFCWTLAIELGSIDHFKQLKDEDKLIVNIDISCKNGKLICNKYLNFIERLLIKRELNYYLRPVKS